MKTKQTQKNIPDGWESKKLLNVGVFFKGSGISKAEVSSVGHCAVRYGELYTTHHYKIKKIKSYISDNIVPATKKIAKGDIVFAGSGETIDEIGKSAVYLDNAPCYAGGDTIIFSPRKDDGLFLSYLLNSKKTRRELRKLGQGQSVVHIYKKDLEKLKVDLPNIKEQKRIVKVLETWDGAIEVLERKIALKREVKKGLMQRLLTGDVQLYGFSGEWRKVKIEDVASILKGSDLSKGKLSKDGEYKCVLYGELYTKYNECISRVVSSTNFDEGTVSQEGDVLIPASTTTSALDLAVATSVHEDGVRLGGDINILRVKNNSFDGSFISHYLTHAKKHELARLAQGITIVHLYGKDIKKININLPEKDEQVAMSNIFIKVQKEIELLEQKLTFFKGQKKYLLNNLVTGAIRTPENI